MLKSRGLLKARMTRLQSAALVVREILMTPNLKLEKSWSWISRQAMFKSQTSPKRIKPASKTQLKTTSHKPKSEAYTMLRERLKSMCHMSNQNRFMRKVPKSLRQPMKWSTIKLKPMPSLSLHQMSQPKLNWDWKKRPITLRPSWSMSQGLQGRSQGRHHELKKEQLKLPRLGPQSAHKTWTNTYLIPIIIHIFKKNAFTRLTPKLSFVEWLNIYLFLQRKN